MDRGGAKTPLLTAGRELTAASRQTPRRRKYMFKKVAIVGAAGLLTAAVLTQTHVGSYLCHQFNKADKYLESKIPPEEEIRQIKEEVASLDKEIDKARGSVAEERWEAKSLKGKVEEKRAQAETNRSAVEARARVLKEAGNSSKIKFDGREIPYDRAKEMLQAQVNAQKNIEKEVKALETMQAVREKTRDLAEQHLQALVTQKAELEAAVTELEADVKLAKIEQVQSKYQNDGSKMADVKERLNGLRKRIEVQREKLNLAKQYDKATVENKTVDEIMAELDTKGTETVRTK
jgi:peptidoglycan hydrolase CwlO-like protein